MDMFVAWQGAFDRHQTIDFWKAVQHFQHVMAFERIKYYAF